MDDKKSAGILLLLIACFQTCVWLIFLLVSNPAYITWKESFSSLLLPENEIMPWFIASIASIVLSSICAITYFSKSLNSKPILLVLLIMCILQAAPAVWFLGWLLKVFYLLPVLPAYKAYKNPNNAINSDCKKHVALS